MEKFELGCQGLEEDLGFLISLAYVLLPVDFFDLETPKSCEVPKYSRLLSCEV